VTKNGIKWHGFKTNNGSWPLLVGEIESQRGIKGTEVGFEWDR
jgi:hypothetical protein